MKKDMPLEGLRWSRDSGFALYDTPQTAVLGQAGGWKEEWHDIMASSEWPSSSTTSPPSPQPIYLAPFWNSSNKIWY